MIRSDSTGDARQPMQHRTSSARQAAALLTIVAANAASAAPDSDTLIARLARPPPASIAFAEVRFSSLLREPLVVSGTLEYEGAGALQRHVEIPYRENTTIRDEIVRIERDGGPVRTFALRRAPELRGLLTVMSGLLTGDGSLIAAHFSVTASGDDARWRLDLTPTDDRLREHLTGIVIVGGDAEPHCFVLRGNRNSASIMLLGAAAGWHLQPPLAMPELLDRCGAE
jgi:hypothetical protein